MRRIFDLGEDTDAPFIALQHKRRATRDEMAATHAENERKLKEQRDYIDSRVKFGEETAKTLQPITDMWTAVNQRDDKGQPVVGADGQPIIDYDMLEVAVEATTGRKLDDLIRGRARRGQSNPELAKERARAARAERELAQLRASQTNGAAGAGTPGNGGAAAVPAPAQPAAPAAPKVTAAQAEAKWGPDVPKAHGLRELAGWAEELHSEMEKFYDEGLNEYSVDTEVIADQILERRLSRLRGGAPAPAAPAPAAAARPVTPKRKRSRAGLAVGPDGLPDPSAMAPAYTEETPRRRGATPGRPEDIENAVELTMKQREDRAMANWRAQMQGKPRPYPAPGEQT